MNCLRDSLDEFEEMMEIERVPRVLYQYTVNHAPVGSTATSVIGDDCTILDGVLLIFRDEQMVAAFKATRWLELTGEAILPQKAVGCCQGSTARDCPEDYCEE